jgi:hypothetical protein
LHTKAKVRLAVREDDLCGRIAQELTDHGLDFEAFDAGKRDEIEKLLVAMLGSFRPDWATEDEIVNRCAHVIAIGVLLQMEHKGEVITTKRLGQKYYKRK